MPLILQLHNRLGKFRNTEAETIVWYVWLIFRRKRLLYEVLAQLPQRSMIDAPVNQGIQRRRSSGPPDELVGTGNRDRMKQGIIGT